MNRSFHLLAALFVTVASSSASAGTVFLQFAGNNATGNVNGSPFSAARWVYEVGVDDTAVDSNANADLAHFANSIVESRISIDGSVYELGPASASGLFYSYQFGGSTQRDQVGTNPSSGGFMQFITGTGGIFPTIFSTFDDLTSANPVSTVFDTTTDNFNNSSMISFQSSQALLGVGGETIEIFENSGPASGNFSLTVSSVSVVPEPSTNIGMLGGLFVLCLRRRKR